MKRYDPDWPSLKEHSVPRWYDDAKFGIFIHWGLYSVPAWAPTTGELGMVPREEWWKRNPYAEWYLNSLRTPGTPTQRYHVKTYGEDFDYYRFADMWKAEKWDPEEWAELFKEAGAKYVIPTTKHHEGFCLWPSKYTNFCVMKKGPNRDIIGELSRAVRKRGLRFGVYYSGALDWRFTDQPITRSEDLTYIRPHTYEYADYAYKQFMELIDEYEPDILWNDIGWPEKGREDLRYLFSYFYNKNPEGLINDRWEVNHWDFKTAEYKQNYPNALPSYKWELCRGLGFSFGYNRAESSKEIMTDEQLVYTLVDVVSKGGNFLLNIGPRADGTIPEIQREKLLTLGKWLEVNGEAIYKTRPWLRNETKTAEGSEVRFTKGKDSLYVVILGSKTEKVKIRSLSVKENTVIRLLGMNERLRYSRKGKDLEVNMPGSAKQVYANVLKISPLP